MLLQLPEHPGSIYGIRVLEELKRLQIETDLVISDWGKTTIELETSYSVSEVVALATRYHKVQDLSASISSGSHKHQGMIIAPCSMKTLSAIACGFEINLIVRAADVTLKERRPLIIVPRETPLTAIHLENMLKLSKLGAVILPPVPAFYSQPKEINDIINQTVVRIMDQLGLDLTIVNRWQGLNPD